MKQIKNILIVAVMVLLAVAAIGCSQKDGASDNADAADYQAKAFTAVMVAEDKSNALFAKSADADGNPILTVKTKEEAESILNNYMDPALTAKVLEHYLTDKTSGDSIIVNAEPFFNPSFLGQQMADVTFGGSKDNVTITTKDNVTYEVKKADSKYVLANVSK